MNLPVPATQGPRRGLPLDQRQRVGSSLASFFSACRRQRRARNVADMAGQIADFAVRIDEAGLLRPALP